VSVQSIDVLEQVALLGTAVVRNNAYVLATRDRPRAEDEAPDTNIVLRVYGPYGSVDVRAPAFFSRRQAEPADLPGPARANTTFQCGPVGWLERLEPPGRQYTRPYDSPERDLYAG